MRLHIIMSFIKYFTHKLDTLILALITMYSINTEEIICRCSLEKAGNSKSFYSLPLSLTENTKSWDLIRSFSLKKKNC